MKKKLLISFGQSMFFLWVCFAPATAVYAQDELRFSTSAQLFDIIQKQTIDEFTAQTGIRVDLFISSSETAMNRLYNQVCDVAGTAEPISYNMAEYGYRVIPICSAPLVVITHPSTAVENVTEEQLRDIFSGKTDNWKDLGGAFRAIVVVPGKNTAAFKNFSLLALKRFDISYDIMTYNSTMVVEVVRNLPGSISFITKGSDTRDASIRILRVNGMAHTQPGYPYFQNFSLVIRANSNSSVTSFIEFMTSAETRAKLAASGISLQNP